MLLLVSLIVILLGVLFVKNSLSFAERFEFPEVVKKTELPPTGLDEVRTAKAVVSLVDPLEDADSRRSSGQGSTSVCFGPHRSGRRLRYWT